MIISHRHKYLYFVVPKCASATIRHSLAPLTDIGYPITDYPQHQTIGQFLQTEYSHLLQEDYFRFTFVRNPYDRIYSAFLQDQYAAAHYSEWRLVKEPKLASVNNDFNRYILEIVKNANIAESWEWICFCPMHEFSRRDGKCLMNFIGRSETLDVDLKKLSTLLRAPIVKSDDKNASFGVSKASDQSYLRYYNRATVEVVNEIYARDFEYFGYLMRSPEAHPEYGDAAPQPNRT